MHTGGDVGAKGATVKQLQEECGAKIDIVRGTSTCKIKAGPSGSSSCVNANDW